MLSEDHKKLSFSKAIEIAQSMETAESKTKEFKGTAAPAVLKLVTQETRQVSQPQKPCYRCGRTNHNEQACRYRQATCHNCGKTGHISTVCRSSKTGKTGPRQKRKPRERPTHWVEPQPTEAEQAQLFTIGPSANLIKVQVKLSGVDLQMEVDTGAALSLISQATRKALLSRAKVHPSTASLRTYTGEVIRVEGEVLVDVQYGQQEAKQLPLIIVDGERPPLLGRNWLQHLRLDWSSIKAVTQSQKSLKSVLDNYAEVFQNELGHIQEFKARLLVREGANPKFCKARNVPFAMKPAVEEELARLERIGVIKKVSTSEWATLVVTVPKKDGTVRLCGDYRVTINPALDVDQYPLPVPEVLFATLCGGKSFTTLDLTQAYQQLELDPESRKYLVINTPRGLYEYTRLPYGVASAPAQFQKVMDTLLQDIQGVICYIDDIMITGATDAEHLANLEEVLRRLQKHGVRVNQAKCKFMADSVEYLGHKIDSEGLHATDGKLQAILQAPAPRNVQELRSFLGLLNYYSKFISNLTTILHPLNQLLQQNRKWRWSPTCKQAFETAKEQLAYCDPL